MVQGERWWRRRGASRVIGSVAGVAIVASGLLVARQVFYGGPAGASRAFLASVASRNLEKAREWLTGEGRAASDAELGSVLAEGAQVRVGRSWITGNYARVAFTTGTTRAYVSLRRESDGWRVYGVGDVLFGENAPLPPELLERRPPRNEAERVAGEFLQAVAAADQKAAERLLSDAAGEHGLALLEEQLAVWRQRAEAGMRFEAVVSESAPIETAEGTEEFLVTATFQPEGGLDVDAIPTQGAFGVMQGNGQAGQAGAAPAAGGAGAGSQGAAVAAEDSGGADEDPRLAEARSQFSGSIDRGLVFVYLRREEGGWRVRGCESRASVERGQGQAVFPLTAEEVEERSIVRNYEQPENPDLVSSAAVLSGLERGDAAHVLVGHTGPVRSVAFAPAGADLLASASRDRTVRLWDAETGALVATLEGHEGSVNAVAFSPQGDTIASGSSDWTIRLWDASVARERRTLLGHVNTVHSVAFGPRADIFVSGSWDSTARSWDLAAGRVLSNLAPSAYDYVSYSVAVAPDGNTVATDGVNNAVILRDLSAGSAVGVLTGHADWVTSVVFSPDGKTVASSSKDRTIKLWDVASLEEIQTLKGHSAGVMSVAFSPDGAMLVSGGQDNQVIFWDLAGGAARATLSGHSATVRSVAFSRDGRTVASGSDDFTVRLWRVPEGQSARR